MTEATTMFNEAIELIEMFDGPRCDPDLRIDEPILKQAHVYSGAAVTIESENGAQENLDEIPAIFLAPEAAVWSWRQEAQQWLHEQKASRWRFIEPPKLVKLYMTETEDRQQRLASIRYGVRSKIGVLEIRKARKRKKAA